MFTIRKHKLILAGCVIIGIVVILSALPAFKLFSQVTLKPPLIAFSLIKKELSAIVLFHRNAGLADSLSKENDRLKARDNLVNELLSENKRLRELLDFKHQAAWRTVAAAVIGRSPENWSSVLFIDKGRLDGIKRGSVVITRLGLAGRVVEAGPVSSKVLLINDPNFSVSAVIQRNRQEGLVTGTLGSSLVMKYLPSEADIQENDVVVTSGLTEIFPKGLLVGRVIKTGTEFSGLGKYALIMPAVDLPGIEEVLVITE